MEFIRPPRLQKGDLVGLISPASPIADASRIDRGVRYLESIGYRVVLGKNITAEHGYLAGTDEQRAADLHTMFENVKVRAILCIRGGYGSPRLLSLLDYRLIRRNPKIFVGYSDITGLQLAMWKKAGLVTFHGPMVGVDMANEMDSFTEETFWGFVTSTKKRGAISVPDNNAEVLFPGKATGRLLGGNLALVVSLLGTPYQPNFSRSVLFIEDIGEEPYRIDRMLIQLRNARILGRTSAILSGQFTDCVPADNTKASLSVDQILSEAAASARRPFVARLPFGHENPKMTIPVGIRARVLTDSGQIEFLEPAVR
ncbi:MAG: LD-carboxypeptidase [Bacteroidetes bacterium]|nr:LD-carboxypeptidase [Bacteroidota bacterium]